MMLHKKGYLEKKSFYFESKMTSRPRRMTIQAKVSKKGITRKSTQNVTQKCNQIKIAVCNAITGIVGTNPKFVISGTLPGKTVIYEKSKSMDFCQATVRQLGNLLS